MELVKCINLNKSYGDKQILKNVNKNGSFVYLYIYT